MIKKILIIFTLISLHSLLYAEDSYQQDYLQTMTIIDSQLKAFLNQDAELAYSYAAPIIQLKFKNSQEIEDRGFFIGLPTNDMSYKTLNFLTEKLLNIKDF